jgi:hypothetical protein
MRSLFRSLSPGLALVVLALAVFTIPIPIRAEISVEDKKENKENNQNKENKERAGGKKDEKENLKKLEKLTAEQLAEVVILAYGGRNELQLVRTNGSEEGNIRLAGDDKDIEGRIVRRFNRKDGTNQDLTRVDVELPTQKLTFGFNGYTVWAARDGLNFTPSAEAEASFLASLTHNYDALLRYKEQESTLERNGSESVVGIDTVLLDLTHKNGEKTRYFISTKTYRILHLEYELKLRPTDQPTKFRESFYDFRPIQNTLVPTKSLLYENGRFIQEIRLTQVKYHTKLDDELFLKF